MQPCAGKCIRGWGESACSAGRGRQIGRYQNERSEWLYWAAIWGWPLAPGRLAGRQNRRYQNAAVRMAVVGWLPLQLPWHKAGRQCSAP